MAATFTFLLSLVLNILLLSFTGVNGKIPEICETLKCPKYDVIQEGEEYEIRRYNSTVLISTTPIQGHSLVRATKTGFKRLYKYISGDNQFKQKIEMTAPLITQVYPGDEVSSYVVSFYEPIELKTIQRSSPSLNAQLLQNLYAAVRQFDGFVTDSNIKEQIAALNASLAGTEWAASISKDYNVAQFNSPFQSSNRVNELWFLIVSK